MNLRMEQGEIVFRSAMVRGDARLAHLIVYSLSGLLGLVFGAGIYVIYMSQLESAFEIAAAILAALVVMLVLFVILAMRLSAKEVVLYPDRMVIMMRLGRIDIPISDILELEPLEPEKARKYLIRLSPVKLTTSTKNAVMIKRKKGVPYIINPENRDEFLEEFSKLESSLSGKGESLNDEAR